MKYEDEYREHQSMLKQEEKDILEQEQDMIASIDKKPFSIGDIQDETMLMIEANLQK